MKKELKDLDPLGRRIFLRADFNVPLDPKTSKILSFERIDSTLPTIQWLVGRGGRVILVSHMGRPDGKYNPQLSLVQCKNRLEEKLGKPIQFCDECIGPKAEYMTSQLKNGDVLLLENIRFYEEEEKPTLEFCEKLSRLADDYVNDAFAVSHRRHASVWNLPKIFYPFRSYAGLQLQKETETISELLSSPHRPFVAIIGGSKISTKIGLLKKLTDIIDDLFIGGAMCLPFLKAAGKLPNMTIDDTQTKTANEILSLSKAKGKSIHLPVDFHCSDALTNPKYEVLTSDKITDQKKPFDLGEETLKIWKERLLKSKTVFWNGPLGAYEWAPYDLISKSLAEFLAVSKIQEIIIGGGDTVACFEKISHGSNIFLSTGGGATLELLENGSLPGYQALSELESSE